MTSRLARAVGLVVWVAALAGCAVNPVTGESEFMLVSPSGARPTRRSVTAAYLAGIVRNLHLVSHRPQLPVDFTLHSASVPNAWAIPGHTAMHRGLLQALENEAQFAFVMGHELGHVAARHTAKRQTWGMVGGGLVGLGAVVFGDGGLGELAAGGLALGTGLVLLRYDRAQEIEADRLGVLYMARAGYDPREALRAHEVLNRAIDQYLQNVGRRREGPGALDELFSTHPRHEARLADLEAFTRQLPPADVRTQGDGRFGGRWAQWTATIRALAPAYAHYDRARVAYRRSALAAAHREVGEALRLGDQAQFSTLQGAILFRERRFPEARDAFARALARYPGYQPALYGLGVAEYRLGRPRQAVPALQESLQLVPGHLPSRYVLGLAFVGTGAYPPAIPHLRAVAEAAPKHPEVHGVLAQAYEATGNPRAAAAAWRAQLAAAPDTDLGRQARQRLQALSATGAESYSNATVRARLRVPATWQVAEERSGRRGGEVVLRREDPVVTLRVASQDYGAPQDLGARLDEAVRERLGGATPTLVRENRSARVGGRTGISRQIEYRSGGVRMEHYVAAVARGNWVFVVDVTAEKDAWRDSAIRAEIERLLDSLAFQ